MSEQQAPVQDLPAWQRAGLSTADVDGIAARYVHADGTEQAAIKAAIKDALAEAVRASDLVGISLASAQRWYRNVNTGQILPFGAEPSADSWVRLHVPPSVAEAYVALSEESAAYADPIAHVEAALVALTRDFPQLAGAAPAGEVAQSPTAATSRPVAIAMALQAADWSAPSIGNKVLIAAAIETLTSPFVGRFTLTPDEIRQIARAPHGSSNAPQGSCYVTATLSYLWERADAASKVAAQALNAEVVPDGERCRCNPPDEIIDGYCQHCGNKVGKSPFAATLERTAIAATRTAYLESILLAVRAQLQRCAADLPAAFDRRVFDCLNEALDAPGAPASHTVPADPDEDAQRWRVVLSTVGARYSDTGAQHFTLSPLLAVGTANLMKGSVAEHFTRAVDAWPYMRGN